MAAATAVLTVLVISAERGVSMNPAKSKVACNAMALLSIQTIR
jgi:hypothetical protein